MSIVTILKIFFILGRGGRVKLKKKKLRLKNKKDIDGNILKESNFE